jgi:hypothetical protein
MRLTAMTFDGYEAGQTDFGTLLATVPQAELNNLLDITSIIAGQITAPAPGVFVSLIVTGHSDRQDRADFSCDQRRDSEIAAATERAVSAWEWIKADVATKVAASGGNAGDWWETSGFVTWGLVFAAAGMLKFNPPSDDERRLNRRVVVLSSLFS